MRTLQLVVVAATAIAAAAPAHAFDLTLDTSGFAGGHLFSDTNKLGRHHDAPDDNALKNTGVIGFRLGFIILHERLSLETELALMPTTTPLNNSSVLVFNWRAHALVHILTGRFRPFVLVGGGGLTSSPSDPPIQPGDNHQYQDTRGEIHGGVGLKADIRCNWGLRADARIIFQQATRGIYFTEDWEFTAGLYGVFGKPIQARCATPKPPTPPPPPQPTP